MSDHYAPPGTGAKPHRFSIDGSGYLTPVVRVDETSPSAGSTGVNTSANQPASITAITGAGNVLLATIAATSSRTVVVIQNQSAATLIVVGDDGTSDTVIWTWLLTGVGADQEGSALPPELGKFKGRLRVYGPTGSRVAVVGV